ncbi:hypothetical protein LJB96_03255, partial [Methanobrevibacter sp. OttesenSCG-928-K11]|nr:hypothetical protein [Methanobrevibacter sp. OttesenSCG-928-K11]
DTIILILVIIFLAVGGVAGYLMLSGDNVDVPLNNTTNKTIKNTTENISEETTSSVETDSYSSESSSENSYQSSDDYSQNTEYSQDSSEYSAGIDEEPRYVGSLD